MRHEAYPPGEAGRARDRRHLERKARELALIESALENPPPPPRHADLSTLLARKFKSAALCRAEAAVRHWTQTETKWGGGPCGSGAFRFDYAYQRADLSVSGPPVYSVRNLAELLPAHYTASGMAALSAVMLALRSLWPGCRFDARADGYPETAELVALFGTSLESDAKGHCIVILDSTVDTAETARMRLRDATAAVFDTSCFAASSSRIRAIVRIAQSMSVPIVLVRSHTKLDCFGLDYGRLGSVAVARGALRGPETALNSEIADFIRLTGAAALPLHFPPFAGNGVHRSLTRARIAWTIHSTRAIAACMRRFADVRVRIFPHGLYIVLYPAPFADKDAACSAAADLARELGEAGVPARHAGSFGFDFFGCDWFEDPGTKNLGLRLSVGDVPRGLVQRAAHVLLKWHRGPTCDRGVSAR